MAGRPMPCPCRPRPARMPAGPSRGRVRSGRSSARDRVHVQHIDRRQGRCHHVERSRARGHAVLRRRLRSAAAPLDSVAGPDQAMTGRSTRRHTAQGRVDTSSQRAGGAASRHEDGGEWTREPTGPVRAATPCRRRRVAPRKDRPFVPAGRSDMSQEPADRAPGRPVQSRYRARHAGRRRARRVAEPGPGTRLHGGGARWRGHPGPAGWCAAGHPRAHRDDR